jgi:hypothetical protein
VTTRLYEDGISGRAERKVPTPPAWLCATPERVASVTLKAILRDRRQVLITPLAHLLFQLKRFVPGLIDFANRFSSSHLKRRFLGRRRKSTVAPPEAVQPSQPPVRTAPTNGANEPLGQRAA